MMSTNGATNCQSTNLAIWWLYPLPCWELKTKYLAESDFNLFVLCRLPHAESHPLALLRPGFLHNLVFKVFPGRACPPSWRKTARQRRCCKFHLMQQGHPTGWVKPAATAILGEAQMWIIRNEALRGLSASSLHPGTFRSSRPSTSHCEAGRGHFPGMSRRQSDKWRHTVNCGGTCNAWLGIRLTVSIVVDT